MTELEKRVAALEETYDEMVRRVKRLEATHTHTADPEIEQQIQDRQAEIRRLSALFRAATADRIAED